ncbi:TylF/MycF/NovP-related O-methyltransferase [Flexivirga meconopsidis]|uniref:TylF/MycF/NovP-related O-methyltransferase n=1 Tax=Flexivirga meconopsidis TaxID=2977121 RepID=UPI00223FB83B|nr:class I SAM-dependent methyltransferase [Flexivirga meconopsidis]
MDGEPKTERLLQQIIERLRIDREIPSTPLRVRAEAVEDGVRHIRGDARFDHAQMHVSNANALRSALAQAPETAGLVAEFGVHRGKSLTIIADHFPDQTVHGFDSFEGLPEAWSGTGKDSGAFNEGGKPPELPVSNVEFHVGWFDDTVPQFAKLPSEPFRFAHLDADLYSSTKTVFDNLGDRFVPGTIVLFDEYFGYHGWQQHEHKAFEEFLATRPDLDFEAVCVGHMNLGVRLVAAGDRK